MRDGVAICDPSELAFAQGATGPLILCLGETSSFNASAIMAAQNARLGRRSATPASLGGTGEAGVATLRAQPNMAAVEQTDCFRD